MNYLRSESQIQSFGELNLPNYLTDTLQTLKMTEPTPVQRLALPVTTQSEDAVILGETGSGKTLIYALTVLKKLESDAQARALVLTPSRETADQIFRVFSKLLGTQTLSKTLLISGQPQKEQASQLRKNPRLIVATPGRLLEHLQGNKLLLQKTAVLVIDEADRMLDDGFGPQLEKIKATMRGEYQSLLLGATFNKSAEKFADKFLREQRYMIKAEESQGPVATLRHVVIYLDQGTKNDRVIDCLKEIEGSAMIFVNHQPVSEELFHHLKSNGVSVDVVHGGFEPKHRDRVMRDFRDEKFRVLVTTDLMARGMDFGQVQLVINYELPSDTHEYIHRIGRTARAGRSGTAVTFVSRYDERLVRSYKELFAGAEVHRENEE